MEVRYESEWLANPARPVFLYQDGIKVGEARQVNFHDNAHVKSKFKLAGLFEEIITPATYGVIHSITNGLPRLVNNLITACLLCAFSEKTKTDRRRSGLPGPAGVKFLEEVGTGWITFSNIC